MPIRREQGHLPVLKEAPTVVLCNDGSVVVRGRENRTLLDITTKCYVTLYGEKGADRIGFRFETSPREDSVPVTPSETGMVKFSAASLVAATAIREKHEAHGKKFFPKQRSYDCIRDEATGVWYLEIQKCRDFRCTLCYPVL